MGFEELKAEALKLAPEFRASLARELLGSLDALSEEEVEGLWIEEAIRRDDEIDRGIAQTSPATEVFTRARTRRK
ncbi:MAG: addiction module protein [Candidatus Tectomicrobia bacterium]|uniref:Addiction module protein n=1 Tax=Tectimicrobiota bacterium TaxID=2528274 RepID=A0A933LQP9_UNCTE|nr:addiction module protein [Candidatus Tectomicrobia bacterium]